MKDRFNIIKFNRFNSNIYNIVIFIIVILFLNGCIRKEIKINRASVFNAISEIKKDSSKTKSIFDKIFPHNVSVNLSKECPLEYIGNVDVVALFFGISCQKNIKAKDSKLILIAIYRENENNYPKDKFNLRYDSDNKVHLTSRKIAEEIMKFNKGKKFLGKIKRFSKYGDNFVYIEKIQPY